MAVLALVLLPPLLLLLLAYLHFVFVTSRYWSKRGVHHLTPRFLLGNLSTIFFTENVMFVLKRWHVENRKRRILGFWAFKNPNLLVMDLDLAKRILVRDFDSFRDRGIDIDLELDPLSGHLFALQGKKWRNIRTKLTPTFTSGRMKAMFPTMVKCGEQLRRCLRTEGGGAVEVKDLLARYTTDVVCSTAFGLESNCLRDPNAEMRQFGRKILEMTWRVIVAGTLLVFSPTLLRSIKLRHTSKKLSDFFTQTMRDTVEYREKHSITRNDFLQLITQHLRPEDVDKTPVDGHTDDELVDKISFTEAVAQCFFFFGAGFETSSAALAFCLYELALNPDIQTRLQAEIDAAGDEITYDRVCGMEYLDQVVQETFRKHPPLPSLVRRCERDYHIPELGVTIEKGTAVHVSVLGVHHDPDIYPEPDRFDPERFTQEERSRRDPFAFLPFGEGPRSCIGRRFGVMQVKVGLISILREYNVAVCASTPIPVVYEVLNLILNPIRGMPLSITRRVQ